MAALPQGLCEQTFRWGDPGCGLGGHATATSSPEVLTQPAEMFLSLWFHCQPLSGVLTGDTAGVLAVGEVESDGG